MERFLIVLFFFFAIPAPWWLPSIKDTKWPLRVKQAIALVLMVLFAGVMTWMLVSEIKGNPYLVAGLKVLILAVFLIGLVAAYNSWPRQEEVEKVTDVREKVQKAIKATEERLGLSPFERLEELNPREGVYSHTLVRYADGSWLEWLNPTNEKGIPDFSYFAVYSNNRQIVKVLSQLVGRYCNVEQQDKPLWR